jgi:multidrug efflux pump subunit AcrA (membrane-fusion protein)
MIKKMLFLLVIILIGFGIFYLYQDSNQLKVSYSRVKQTDYYEKILTTVIVLLEGLTKIKTEVSGKIIDLMSIEGDEIKAGQVLLKFETIDVFLDLK